MVQSLSTKDIVTIHSFFVTENGVALKFNQIILQTMGSFMGGKRDKKIRRGGEMVKY